VIGADIEQEALRHGQERGYRCLFLVRGEAFPLPDASIPLINAFDTIGHIPE
jgi:hypothetical protein